MNNTRKFLLGIVAVFLASRLICLAAGMYDYSGPLRPPYYVAPPYLLQTRLMETLFYLHLQPPLYNLWIGLLLKVFPDGAKAAYLVLSHALGLAICLGLFALMKRLKVPLLVAFVLTALFTLSPGLIHYERHIWHTFICGTFLVLAAVFLHRHLTRAGTIDAAVYYFLLAAAVLTRTTFHFLWFLGAAAIPFIPAGRQWKKLIRAAALPFLLVLGWHVQHIWIFGYPTTSFSLGKQMLLMAIHEMPDEVLEEIVRKSEGKIIEKPTIFLPRPYEFAERFRELPPTGIPALDWEYRYHTQPEHFNANHIAYLHMGREWQSDARIIIPRAPRYFGRSVAFAARDYFRPAEDIFRDDPNNPPPRWERIYDLFYGRFGSWGLITVRTQMVWIFDRRPAWFMLFGFPLLFVYGILAARRRFSRDKPFSLTVIFILWTIFWVTSVIVLMTLGESMRYRSKIDPFYVALLGFFLTDLAARGRRRLTPLVRTQSDLPRVQGTDYHSGGENNQPESKPRAEPGEPPGPPLPSASLIPRRNGAGSRPRT